MQKGCGERGEEKRRKRARREKRRPFIEKALRVKTRGPTSSSLLRFCGQTNQTQRKQVSLETDSVAATVLCHLDDSAGCQRQIEFLDVPSWERGFVVFSGSTERCLVRSSISQDPPWACAIAQPRRYPLIPTKYPFYTGCFFVQVHCEP